jgi:hypothetical protein
VLEAVRNAGFQPEARVPWVVGRCFVVGPHLGFYVGARGAEIGLPFAWEAIKSLRTTKDSPPAFLIIVEGPVDTPLSIITRSGEYDEAFVSSIPIEIRNEAACVQDELCMTWFMSNGRLLQFQLERHLLVSDSPLPEIQAQTQGLALQKIVGVPIGVRVSTVRRLLGTSESPLLTKYSDGLSSLTWRNARITAMRDVVIHKELTLLIRK